MLRKYKRQRARKTAQMPMIQTLISTTTPGFKPMTVLGKSIAPLLNADGTQTFVSIGKFDTELEARNCQKYINTKFARALFSTPQTWEFVPLQDFTAQSDIDWSVSLPEIDAQLYRKYGLTWKEIAYIESSVKYRE